MRTQLIVLLSALAALLAGCVSSPDQLEKTGPQWDRDVVPIIETSCMPCHRTGSSVGLALDARNGFIASGEAVLWALESGAMPPGSVDRSGACGDYRGHRPVTRDDIAVITQFLEGSVVEDVKTITAISAMAAPRGKSQALPLPRYRPNVDDDDHRCFIMETSEASGAALTGLGVQTRAGSALHHLMVYSLPSAAAISHAQALAGQDEEPGFPCEGHPHLVGSELLSVWTPGQGTIAFPPDTGVATQGSMLLVQAHFHVEDSDSARRRSPLAPIPVLKHGRPQWEEVIVTVYTADHVPTLMRPVPIAATEFALPPGRERVDFSLSGPAPFPDTVMVHGVFPHMHTTGNSIRLDVGFEDQNQCLTQSTRWRFEQQDTAFFQAPRTLAPSTPLTLNCTWNTQDRDRVTHWGEGSLDEMCTVFLFVSSSGPEH